MSEEKKIWYYAQINTDSKLCCGVSQLCGEKIQDDMIELESYDMSLIGKMWTGTWNEETQSWDGGEWIENPNPPEPPEPSTEPTMSDLSDKMDAQQSLQLASMQGQADQYTTTLAMQEQINAQQQLILANMQGLADVYTTLLSMQTPTGTEA